MADGLNASSQLDSVAVEAGTTTAPYHGIVTAPPPGTGADPDADADTASPVDQISSAVSHRPPASPYTANNGAISHNAALPRVNTLDIQPKTTSLRALSPSSRTPHRSPVSAGLHLRTDIPHTFVSTPSDASSNTMPSDTRTGTDGDAISALPAHADRPPLKSNLSAASLASSLSPGSALSSPALAAMTDITPLPSPFLPGDSPGPWRRVHTEFSIGTPIGRSRNNSLEKISNGGISRTPSRSSPTKAKKHYSGLHPASIEPHANHSPVQRKPSHSRNRSLSEYIPEHMHNQRPRQVTIGSPALALNTPSAYHMHREQYLAPQRGLTHSTAAATLPTPPPSNRSVTESEGDEDIREQDLPAGYLSVRQGPNKRKKRYWPVRELGQGTFSKVLLASSDPIASDSIASSSSLNPKHLVAVKVVQHGPAGGADEERVELGLKREVEILRSISHPSLVHLKAFDFDETQALLILGYCPGGDLFEFASEKRDLLTVGLVQRMFAELVSAVSYLHDQLIVHRDIKLENVLVNVLPSVLSSMQHPQSHPTSLITLTDLGLSRRISPPPASPLLTTRCGSEDYAAPEILLAQPYDGRQTDAWALGVLLYALMEGRLPFDPLPGRRSGRSRTTHRIARCEWVWCRFGDEDGDWDENAPASAEWEGAKTIVESLLKKTSRGRAPLEKIAKMQWVKGGIQLEGGKGLQRGVEGENEADDETIEDVTREYGAR